MRRIDPGVAASRRRFLRRLGSGSIAALALSPVGELLAAVGRAGLAGNGMGAGYGRLRAMRDETTDLPLLRLPEGFRYRSFGWAGERLADGSRCPGNHDGMGIVRVRGDRLTLVRNHEITALDGAFGQASCHYDPRCSGGTVTLDYDLARGELIEARPSLSGTLTNCAGGTTPWGSWLSCEEFVCAAGEPLRRGGARVEQAHGFVFEVPADGVADARPLRAMGQFRHEAAVVHAATGELFLTEDTEPTAGFFRFIPTTAGVLADGGRLQMLAVAGHADLRSGLRVGQQFDVGWVDIDEPERGIDARGGILGVQAQGRARGGSVFTRLEGCVADEHEVFFVATNGGDAAAGQVFSYRPAEQRLTLIFESGEAAMIDYPDNIVTSPRGGLLLCQDSKQSRQHLYGIGRDGGVFVFAQQNVVLDGAMGFSGDFRGAEWAGACFSPDGQWLFANVFSPGFTVAITGPWRDGLI